MTTFFRALRALFKTEAPEAPDGWDELSREQQVEALSNAIGGE